MKIIDFINALRESDEYIKYIYTQGGCYQFSLLLAKMYKSVAYISMDRNHIVSKYRGKFYDINGEVENVEKYRLLNCQDLEIVEGWSFRKNNLLLLNICPNCDEPLTFNTEEK